MPKTELSFRQIVTAVEGLPERQRLQLIKLALQEIVWVLGRTKGVPPGVPSFVRRGWGGRKLAGLHAPRLTREAPQPLDASTPPCLPLQRGGNGMVPTQKPEEPG